MEDIKVGDCVIITNFETNDEWSPHYKGEISVIDRIDYPFYYLENDNTTPFTKEQLRVLRVISTKNKFNMIKCKKCGSANVKVDFSQVYTSIPEMYGYVCQDCGEHGYINCDEVNRLDFDFNGVQEIKETPNTPKEENKGGMMGWICPKCGRCYSPFVSMCSFCNNGNWNNTITCFTGTDGTNIY
jgi:hypothetical protein